MDKNNKTVEQQIADSDFVNFCKEKGGEAGAEMARSFLEMNDTEKLLSLLHFGLLYFFDMKNYEEFALPAIVIKLLQADKQTTTLFIELLIKLMSRRMRKEEESGNNSQSKN